MDPVPPKIVIEPPPQDATANIRRYSAGRSKIFYPHYQKNRVIAGKTLVRTPLEEIEELDESGTAFAKLVKTVQFIKKWAGKAEEPIHGREEFLERFKMSGPIIEENNTESSEEEEEEKSATNNVKCSKKFFQLNPMGTVLYGWLAVVTVAFLYNAFMMSARYAYIGLHGPATILPLWFLLDYTADAIYAIDIGVHFLTSYLEQGLPVISMKKLAFRYMKSHAFKLDVLSLLPFDFLYLIPSIGTGATIVRINRLFKGYRVMQFYSRTESRTNFPNLVRVFALLLFLTLLIHVNGCIYFLISKSIGFGSDTWVYPALMDEYGNLTEYASLSRQYLFTFYWSTLTLTTIGELPGPTTDPEYLFVIVDFLIGVLIFATIVGMVGGIITNTNIRRMDFQRRLDNIKQYMRYRDVGKELQVRVIKWFDYLWVNKHSLEEEHVLETLPDKLKAEIAIHVHFETLRQVEIFEECEAGLLEELVLKLKPQVYSPGDYICRKGDIGKEMFIIKHGCLEVVGDDGSNVLATLTDGDYFGEISILNLGGSGNRRTANVRSVGYSELFCLSKSDLLEALQEYPEAKAMLEERGRKTLMRDGTWEPEDFAPAKKATKKREELPQIDRRAQKKIDVLEVKLVHLHNRFNRLLKEYNLGQMKLKQRIYVLEHQ